MRFSPNRRYLVCERGQHPSDGLRRIEVRDAQTGTVVATMSAGFNPRWLGDRSIVAESPEGFGFKSDNGGFSTAYLPANRGQLDANGHGVWAVSDLRDTRMYEHGAESTVRSAREPRISDSGIVAVRRPDTGWLRLPYPDADLNFGGDFGPCEDSRWGSETLAWWLDGAVWGRTTPGVPTTLLTIAGRACAKAVPCWHAQDGRLWVGLVLDAGELAIVEFGRQDGYKVGVSSGGGFDWDITEAGPGRLRVAYFDPFGVPVFADVDVTQPPVSLAPPPNPEPPLPDIPWTPDATRTVDMLEYVLAAASAVRYSADGLRGDLWLHKSQERPDWGENWSFDADYIGFVEDRSTGTRMVSFARPADPQRPHKNLTRDRMSPEEIQARNAVGANLGDPLTLPLAGYTWRGNHPWMIRHVTGHAALSFATDFVWWDEAQYGGVWEAWNGLPLTIETVAGYARMNGHDVYALTRYGKPAGNEWNAWGPHGWIAFLAFNADGSEDVAARRVAPPEQRASPLTAPFVAARFPTVYPIYTPVHPPDPEPDMTAADIRRYAAELPDAALFGALERFHNEVLPRDRPKDGVIPSAADTDMWTGDVVTGGANGYLMRAMISEYLIARDAGRTPEQALGDGYDAAKRAYDKAVTPQPPVQPGTLSGPITVAGRDFEVPS